MAFHLADDPRDQRLETRVTPEDKVMIQNAAAARGRSVSQFIVQRALQRSDFSNGEWRTLRELRGTLETLQYLAMLQVEDWKGRRQTRIRVHRR
ncbi:DUF1778 domain-containing protein [Paraburkholderia sp. XV]|uniref:type II toxin-antitoxin system TacA family antitoxin n=1 Tax=Paraburkholderia sp. XV TaxID=2831520 RepID=UPI001CD4FF65